MLVSADFAPPVGLPEAFPANAGIYRVITPNPEPRILYRLGKVIGPDGHLVLARFQEVAVRGVPPTRHNP